jgi:hypothetical protein
MSNGPRSEDGDAWKDIYPRGGIKPEDIFKPRRTPNPWDETIRKLMERLRFRCKNCDFFIDVSRKEMKPEQAMFRFCPVCGSQAITMDIPTESELRDLLVLLNAKLALYLDKKLKSKVK